MADKYLDELNSMKDNVKKDYKEGYRRGQEYKYKAKNILDYYKISDEVKKTLENPSTNKNVIISHPDIAGQESYLSGEAMRLALKNSNPSLALQGALLYERIGMGNRTSVKRRLMKVLKKEEN